MAKTISSTTLFFSSELLCASKATVHWMDGINILSSLGLPDNYPGTINDRSITGPLVTSYSGPNILQPFS